MTKMLWNQEMGVGVQELDEDHKELVTLLNEVEDATATGQRRDSINEIVDRLMESVKTHFAREEAFLVEFGYPGAAAHQCEHDLMLRTGLELQARFRSDSSPMISLESVSSLRSWLDNHIQGADRQYGPHLNTHGVY
jgi:hemerythrin-like metal-binding protein